MVRSIVVDGMSDPEIAEALGISRGTVRVHRMNALRAIRRRRRLATPFCERHAGRRCCLHSSRTGASNMKRRKRSVRPFPVHS